MQKKTTWVYKKWINLFDGILEGTRPSDVAFVEQEPKYKLHPLFMYIIKNQKTGDQKTVTKNIFYININ